VCGGERKRGKEEKKRGGESRKKEGMMRHCVKVLIERIL